MFIFLQKTGTEIKSDNRKEFSKPIFQIYLVKIAKAKIIPITKTILPLHDFLKK
jgi:hypothetical protein